jgi:hypothetical protein
LPQLSQKGGCLLKKAKASQIQVSKHPARIRNTPHWGQFGPRNCGVGPLEGFFNWQDSYGDE